MNKIALSSQQPCMDESIQASDGGRLWTINPKAAERVAQLRKEVAEFKNLGICGKVLEEVNQKKRGAKADKDYLPKAINRLETLYMEYNDHPYEKDASKKDKKERIRRRNEISALESRIMKRLEEMEQYKKTQTLENRVRIIL